MNWNWPIQKKVAVLLLIALQVGDFFTTIAATASAKVVELNPLINHAGSLSIGRMGAAKLFAMLISWVVVYRARRMWLVWTTCGIYTAIVISNTILALVTK